MYEERENERKKTVWLGVMLIIDVNMVHYYSTIPDTSHLNDRWGRRK